MELQQAPEFRASHKFYAVFEVGDQKRSAGEKFAELFNLIFYALMEKIDERKISPFVIS
jgi:hypothetical protein